MLDSVTINQLRTFVAVCEEGSFSGAAKKLLRAQSAVSHAIAALEQALDVALFERAAPNSALPGETFCPTRVQSSPAPKR